MNARFSNSDNKTYHRSVIVNKKKYAHIKRRHILKVVTVYTMQCVPMYAKAIFSLEIKLPNLNNAMFSFYVAIRTTPIGTDIFKNNSKARKKNVLVLVIGRVDFDANKKKRAEKKITPRKIESGIFFPVNHRHPRSSAFRIADMNILGFKFMFLCTF